MTAKTSFNQLYTEHYARVFGLCRRLLNSATSAEDATQESFMRAYKKLSSYDPQKSFWPWIATIANNHCIDLLRKQNRLSTWLSHEALDDEQKILDTIESKELPPLDTLIHNESKTELTAIIDQLPDKYRIPLTLAYFSDTSYEQIASELAISRNHVSVLILRAKQQLRLLILHGGIQL
jgi:RNA polymerase sigma-70 factor (ECF subfamily)